MLIYPLQLKSDKHFTFHNDNIGCYNSVGDTGIILGLNANANQYVKSHSLLLDTASNTLTGGYLLDVVNSAILREDLRVDGNIDLTNNTGDIQLPTAAVDMFRERVMLTII